MQELCDLKVHINGQHTFIINKKIICTFSKRLKRLVRQEKKRSEAKSSGLKLMDFPGGSHGFELISRFCYNNGSINITTSNVCTLHCAAILLEMTEDASTGNLLQQTIMLLENMVYWKFQDLVAALRSCESFFFIANTTGLIDKLIASLVSKISQNLEALPIQSTASLHSSSSSSSSPDTLICTKTPETMKPCLNREWWFDELTVLGPYTIAKLMKALEAYKNDYNNKNQLIYTRFLLYYLKASLQRPNFVGMKQEYCELADIAVHGVTVIGKVGFSCRGLFWVLRLVSGFGLSRECMQKLERVMGLMLDQATLDDLLVSGHEASSGLVYDVNLVLRLVRIFVSSDDHGDDDEPVFVVQKMKKVGRLIDKYLGEISPDHSLKVSKFLAVAESLPDSARDCFDGVYRALDIYLESHPSMATEERTTLCRCLNYEKLTLEACKDLAKNKRIPPGVAVQALVSQQSKLQIKNDNITHKLDREQTPEQAARVREDPRASPAVLDEKEELKANLQRMQSRVMKLEKVCKDMKGQMSKMAKNKSFNNSSSRGMPRLC